MTAPTILTLASHASAAADRYKMAIDDRQGIQAMLTHANALADATCELTTAIADSVAESDGRICRS